jgi:hypothetical protein
MKHSSFTLTSEQTLHLVEMRDALAKALPENMAETVQFPIANYTCKEGNCQTSCALYCAANCSGGCSTGCYATCKAFCGNGCGLLCTQTCWLTCVGSFA